MNENKNTIKGSFKFFGIEIKNFSFDQFNKKAFAIKAEKLIKYSPDAVLIAPVFYDEAVKFLNKCQENMISFAFINSNIDNGDYLSYVGQDSTQSGYLAGKLISYGLNKRSKILIVNISKALKNNKHLLKRKTGFEKYFSDHKMSKIKLISHDINDTNQNIVNESLSKVFQNNINISGIYVTNSKVFKIAEFLENNNLGQLRVIGYDLIEENIPYLEKGVIDFLISQNPVEQGYNGIMALFNFLVLKKQVIKDRLLPIDIITKENLKYYLK